MAKTVNYTPEMTAQMIEMYNTVRDSDEATRAAMVQEIADTVGKNVRSVRAKLSRENVYVAKTVVSKVTGDTPAKKIELATRLVTDYNVNADPENVAKMNKLDIQAFIDAFESLTD